MGSLQDIGGPATFLKRQLGSVNGLRSLPWLERLKLRAAFQNEEIRLGSSQDWLGRKWELRVAAVDGIIYKAAIETVALNKEDAIDLTTDVFSLIQKAIGEFMQKSDELFLWDADDGNVVLQLASVGGERRIMIFLTSNIAKKFVPR